MRERLRTLFDANLNFAAYHLALDAHPEIGNNAYLCRELGVEAERVFAEVGWGGTLREPVAASAFAERVQELVGRMPLVFSYGPEEIRRVAVCSGGAARRSTRRSTRATTASSPARRPSRRSTSPRRRASTSSRPATTPRRRRASSCSPTKIAERFGVEWEFVDLPNPV